MESYWDKLKDPRWQKKRLEVLNDRNFSCEYCGDSKNTLYVHHPAYISGRDPWDYAIDELQSLCEDCHKYQHQQIDRITNLINDIKLHHCSSGLTTLEELAGIITAYSHDGPFDIQVDSAEFAMGVGIVFRVTEQDVISSLVNGAIPEKTIYKWKSA